MPHFTSSKDPLQYLGDPAVNPPNIYQEDRAPTSADNSPRYRIGDVWVDTFTNETYTLTELTSTGAIWALTGSASGALNTLSINSGGTSVGAVGNNIDFRQSAPLTSGIIFTSSGPGIIEAAVNVDNTTIGFDATGRLTASTRSVFALTTNNNIDQAIFTAAVPSPHTTAVHVLVTAYNTTDGEGLTADIQGGWRNNGATNIVIGSPSIRIQKEGGMALAMVGLGVSGNNGDVLVTGLTGKVINWEAHILNVDTV